MTYIKIKCLFLISQVLSNLGEKMSDAEIEIMMQEADDNKDGKINYEGKFLLRPTYYNVCEQ